MGIELTWAEFQKAFNDNYFPGWMREQKVYEFIELKQVNKTVAEYEAKFTLLARFSPKLVSFEANKVTKFQRGLRAEIQHALAGARIMDYLTIVQRVYAIERDRFEMGVGMPSSKEAGSSKRRNYDKKRRWDAGMMRNPPEILARKFYGKRPL